MILRILQRTKGILIVLICLSATGCGPRANIPPRPVSLALPGVLSADDAGARLARSLAPLDGNGFGEAYFTLLPGTAAPLVGITLHHAFLVLDPFAGSGTSSRVKVSTTPTLHISFPLQ